MSRIIFWSENNNIEKEIVYNKEECKNKCNDICFDCYSKKLGKKCHGCEKFTQEDNKVEPYYD